MKYLLCCQGIRTLQTITFRFSGIVLFFLLMAIPINANSDTVHALLIIMDADPNLGSTMKVNQENVEKLLTTIQDETDLHVKKKLLLSSRNEVRKSYIMMWLEEINPGNNDVVFVYFSGFGGATAEIDTKHDVFMYLQDGKYRQSELAHKVQGISKCRLKILITDRCKGFLKSAPIPDHKVKTVYDKHIETKHLFMEHEGFLHISSAAEGEYGWVDKQIGGLFTDTLLHTIIQSSASDVDTNTDGFITWTEIFDVISQKTGDRFQQAYPLLSESLKEFLREQGSTSQSPTAYELPKPLAPLNIQSDLWNLTNPEHNFSLFLNTDRPNYQLNDFLTLRVLVTDDAHIIILNWDSTGKLTLLFPNSFEHNNLIKAGVIHAFPNPQSDFDYLLSGSHGMERFKGIAIRHTADSKAIVDLFPKINNSFQSVPNHQRSELEKEILTYLRQMKTTGWAVAGQTVEVRDAEPAQPPDFDTPIEIQPDYGKGDIVYIKDGNYMYFGEVIAEINEDSETVMVNIFNETLRKKLGDAVPSEFVLGRRVEPHNGWGKKLVMISFYRNETWTFTDNSIMFEDHYLLPEMIDNQRIQEPRKVKLSDVRIPIVVPFLSSE